MMGYLPYTTRHSHIHYVHDKGVSIDLDLEKKNDLIEENYIFNIEVKIIMMDHRS